MSCGSAYTLISTRTRSPALQKSSQTRSSEHRGGRRRRNIPRGLNSYKLHSRVFSETTKRVTSSSVSARRTNGTLHAEGTRLRGAPGSCSGRAELCRGSEAKVAQQGRAISQHALAGRAVSHTVLSLADRRTCCDTVSSSCRDCGQGSGRGWPGCNEAFVQWKVKIGLVYLLDGRQPLTFPVDCV